MGEKNGHRKHGGGGAPAASAVPGWPAPETAASRGQAVSEASGARDAAATSAVASASPAAKVNAGLMMAVGAVRVLLTAAAALITVKLRVLRACFPATVFILGKGLKAAVFAVAVAAAVTSKVLKKVCEMKMVAGLIRVVCGKLWCVLPRFLGNRVYSLGELLASKAPAVKAVTIDDEIADEEKAHLDDIDKMTEVRKSLFKRDKRLSNLREKRLSQIKPAAEPAADPESESESCAKVTRVDDEDADGGRSSAEPLAEGGVDDEELLRMQREEAAADPIVDDEDVKKPSFCGFRC